MHLLHDVRVWQRGYFDTESAPERENACEYSADGIEKHIVDQKKERLKVELSLWVKVIRVWAIATNDTTPFRLVILEGDDNATEFRARMLRPCPESGWHVHEAHFDDPRILISEDALLCAVDVRHLGQNLDKKRVRVHVCEEHCIEIVLAILGQVELGSMTLDAKELILHWKTQTLVSVRPFGRKTTPLCEDAYFDPARERPLRRGFAYTVASSPDQAVVAVAPPTELLGEASLHTSVLCRHTNWVAHASARTAVYVRLRRIVRGLHWRPLEVRFMSHCSASHVGCTCVR